MTCSHQDRISHKLMTQIRHLYPWPAVDHRNGLSREVRDVCVFVGRCGDPIAPSTEHSQCHRCTFGLCVELHSLRNPICKANPLKVWIQRVLEASTGTQRPWRDPINPGAQQHWESWTRRGRVDTRRGPRRSQNAKGDCALRVPTAG